MFEAKQVLKCFAELGRTGMKLFFHLKQLVLWVTFGHINLAVKDTCTATACSVEEKTMWMSGSYVIQVLQ